MGNKQYIEKKEKNDIGLYFLIGIQVSDIHICANEKNSRTIDIRFILFF